MSDKDAREARKQFEAYEINVHTRLPRDLRRPENGNYWSSDMQQDWELWQAATVAAESQRRQAPSEQSIRAALVTHWLSQIECNHYEKNDSAICACGWKSDRGFNVGKAVEFWINHVFEVAGTQAQAAQWIRVTPDSMPEYDVDVHLWGPGWPRVYIGYWRHSNEWIGRSRPESDEPLPNTNPTFWQPLPVAPAAALEGNKEKK